MDRGRGRTGESLSPVRRLLSERRGHGSGSGLQRIGMNSVPKVLEGLVRDWRLGDGASISDFLTSIEREGSCSGPVTVWTEESRHPTKEYGVTEDVGIGRSLGRDRASVGTL